MGERRQVYLGGERKDEVRLRGSEGDKTRR